MYSQRPYVDCDRIIGPEEPKYEECPSGKFKMYIVLVKMVLG